MVAGLLTAGHVAMADADAEVAYRQAVMKSVGGHMSAMATSLRNQVYMEDLVLHARGLAGLADIAPHIFPEGSVNEKSKTLPAVWEQPLEFQQAMDRFIEASEGMVTAAANGDMAEIGPAIQALGGSCKGCHDDYQAE